MYPNQNQLPFSPDQVQRPYLPNINANNPPFVPQGIQGHPQVMQLVPGLAGWAAAEIQQQAETNPLRRFFFNMYGMNNFANEEFASLVQAIADYLELVWSQNPNAAPQQLMEKAVVQTIEMFVSNLVRLFPPLGGYLNQQTQGIVWQQIQVFDGVKQQIQALRSRMPQGGGYGYPAQQQGFQSRVDPRLGGAGVSLAGGNQPSFLTHQPPQGNAPMTSQGNSMATRWGSAKLVSDDQPAPHVVKIGGSNTGGVKTTSVNVAPSSPVPTMVSAQQQEVQQAQEVPVQTQQVQHGELEPIYATRLKWKRSEKQPFFPAWNPDKQNLFLQELADGTVIVQVKNPEKSTVDYERHKIQSVFGAPYRALDVAQVKDRVEAIQIGLANIEAEAEFRDKAVDGQDNPQPAFPTHVNPVFAVDLMEELVWIKAGCGWLESTKNGKKADIYRRYGYVVELVVGQISEDNLIETLRETRTWEGFWKVLNELKATMSVPLWIRINQRMTELVNRVLTFNLSLTTTIDSYADDLPDLINVLREKYGEVILKAFKNNESYLIHSVFETVLADDEIASLESLFLTEDDPNAEHDPEKVKPVFTHLIKAASFTFLNCLSHELRLEMNGTAGALLTQALTPVMYDIAKGIIEETNAVQETTFANHYIQTLDGKILEIDTGFLGEESYLIRLVK
jgi:hypothetical protein